MSHIARTILITSIWVSTCLTASAGDDKILVPSITVTGTGSMTAKPDMAEIQVGVVTEGPNASEALTKNTANMQKLFASLKARGIAEKDMQTTQFQVSPRYRHDKEGRQLPEIIGYRVSNVVELKVRQLAILGQILDELVQQGANQIHGISFSIAEPETLLDEARRKAMTNARHRAQLYAETAQVKLGKVLLIQEQSPSIPRPQFYGMAERVAADVPIAPGEQKLQVRISVTFRLE